MGTKATLSPEEQAELKRLKLHAIQQLLEKHPMHITKVVHLAGEEFNLPQHIVRASVERWVEGGELEEVRKKVTEGPGRPRRIIGGAP